ncbi:Metallo-dependent phosphatase-like protein [Aspergillus germanicus]
MLLTLRLISIDDLAGTPYDNQSLSSKPDDRSSDLSSDARDRNQDVEARSDNAQSEPAMSKPDFDRQPERGVEISEDIDWAYIVDPHELDERPRDNLGMDMDVSDTDSEPVIDSNSESKSTSVVDKGANTGLSRVSWVHDLLLADDSGEPVVQVPEEDIRDLCTAARKIFLSKPILLELMGPMKVVGDIRGQWGDLLRVFKHSGFPPKPDYLFLGNYVDYGRHSIEVICLVLAYKVLYPRNFFLLRGSHESAWVSRAGEFYGQCERGYNTALWEALCEVFNCMPVAAIADEKIFCIPATGLLRDLLWSNPSRNVYYKTRDLVFRQDVVTQFLQKHDMDLIFRGHEVVDVGYEFFAHRQLVTIFSAAEVIGKDGNKAANKAAMPSLDEGLLCSFYVHSTYVYHLLADCSAGGLANKSRPNMKKGESARGPEDEQSPVQLLLGPYAGDVRRREFSQLPLASVTVSTPDHSPPRPPPRSQLQLQPNNC